MSREVKWDKDYDRFFKREFKRLPSFLKTSRLMLRSMKNNEVEKQLYHERNLQDWYDIARPAYEAGRRDGMKKQKENQKYFEKIRRKHR